MQLHHAQQSSALRWRPFQRPPDGPKTQHWSGLSGRVAGQSCLVGPVWMGLALSLPFFAIYISCLITLCACVVYLYSLYVLLFALYIYIYIYIFTPSALLLYPQPLLPKTSFFERALSCDTLCFQSLSHVFGHLKQGGA